MTRCLESGNVEAHHVHGIHDYVHKHNTYEGPEHLHTSFEGLEDNVIYLYGIQILCRGEKKVMKAY